MSLPEAIELVASIIFGVVMFVKFIAEIAKQEDENHDRDKW